MANDFDQFPVYDPLIKTGTNKLSDVWISFMSTFYMNLIAYLTQGGIMLPQLTTSQRNALINLQNGQTIYNTTLDTAQYYQVSSKTWISYP